MEFIAAQVTAAGEPLPPLLRCHLPELRLAQENQFSHFAGTISPPFAVDDELKTAGNGVAPELPSPSVSLSADVASTSSPSQCHLLLFA